MANYGYLSIKQDKKTKLLHIQAWWYPPVISATQSLRWDGGKLRLFQLLKEYIWRSPGPSWQYSETISPSKKYK